MSCEAKMLMRLLIGLLQIFADEITNVYVSALPFKIMSYEKKTHKSEVWKKIKVDGLTLLVWPLSALRWLS
jgi:hypothetical protein